MTEDQRPGGIARYYKKFRAGKAFIISLTVIMGTIFFCHYVFGFDKDWGMTNLFLSLEASYSMALFMALQEQLDGLQQKNDEHNRLMLEYIKKNTEANLSMQRQLIDITKKIEQNTSRKRKSPVRRA